jgi:hypothetical protein
MRHYQRYHVHQIPPRIPINSDLFPTYLIVESPNLTIDSQPHRRPRHRISRVSLS